VLGATPGGLHHRLEAQYAAKIRQQLPVVWKRVLVEVSKLRETNPSLPISWIFVEKCFSFFVSLVRYYQ
jgi:hypothetical protein